LLEQCSIAFDGSDKTRKVFGASLRKDREKLHRDTREGLRTAIRTRSRKVIARMRTSWT
jgi:hypothetical protein